MLVPIALALLLSFVLAPIVRRLQSWRVPRVAAVTIGNVERFGDDEAAGNAEVVQQSAREAVDKLISILVKQAGVKTAAQKPKAA